MPNPICSYATFTAPTRTYLTVTESLLLVFKFLTSLLLSCGFWELQALPLGAHHGELRRPTKSTLSLTMSQSAQNSAGIQTLLDVSLRG